ncbi:hypothetical protein AgCh_038886 [Apium graveolens]
MIRGGRKPDGFCLVVGSCCRGFADNKTSDVIYASAQVKHVGQSQVQYFWEIFSNLIYSSLIYLWVQSPVQYFWEAFPAEEIHVV